MEDFMNCIYEMSVETCGFVFEEYHYGDNTSLYPFAKNMVATLDEIVSNQVTKMFPTSLVRIHRHSAGSHENRDVSFSIMENGKILQNLSITSYTDCIEEEDSAPDWWEINMAIRAVVFRLSKREEDSAPDWWEINIPENDKYCDYIYMLRDNICSTIKTWGFTEIQLKVIALELAIYLNLDYVVFKSNIYILDVANTGVDLVATSNTHLSNLQLTYCGLPPIMELVAIPDILMKVLSCSVSHLNTAANNSSSFGTRNTCFVTSHDAVLREDILNGKIALWADREGLHIYLDEKFRYPVGLAIACGALDLSDYKFSKVNEPHLQAYLNWIRDNDLTIYQTGVSGIGNQVLLFFRWDYTI